MNKGCDAPCPPDQKGTVNSKGHQVLIRLQAHFLAADFAAPRVVAVCSSVAEFQALAIRFTANVLFPGTLWVALLLLIDLVDLKMVLFGNSLWNLSSSNWFGPLFFSQNWTNFENIQKTVTFQWILIIFVAFLNVIPFWLKNSGPNKQIRVPWAFPLLWTPKTPSRVV